MLLPDGYTVVYFTGPNAIGGVATLDSLAALRPLATLASGQVLELSGGNPLVTFRVPEGIPRGIYTWFAALVSPGALADGFLRQAEVDVLALRSVTLRP